MRAGLPAVIHGVHARQRRLQRRRGGLGRRVCLREFVCEAAGLPHNVGTSLAQRLRQRIRMSDTAHTAFTHHPAHAQRGRMQVPRISSERVWCMLSSTVAPLGAARRPHLDVAAGGLEAGKKRLDILDDAPHRLRRAHRAGCTHIATLFQRHNRLDCAGSCTAVRLASACLRPCSRKGHVSKASPAGRACRGHSTNRGRTSA